MDLWAWVSVIAVTVFLFTKFVDWKLQTRERMEAVRKKILEAQKKGEEEKQRMFLEATNEMNKILLRRMVISLIVVIPLAWVYHLGSIQTPFGEMGAIWWYVITYLAISGGVWIGSTLQKTIKKDRGKNSRR